MKKKKTASTRHPTPSQPTTPLVNQTAGTQKSKVFGFSQPQLALIVGLVFCVVAAVLFATNLQFPVTHNFDEFHYVPSAKQMLAGIENQNWEHPPLGKQLMAIGISLFGDRAIGWRFMSVVFGVITFGGMLFWSWAFFESIELMLFTGAITLLNQLLFVQSRIGMLDTFMMAFLAWAFAFLAYTWKGGRDPKKIHLAWLSIGACLGLAIASKWFGIIVWAYFLGLALMVVWFRSWGIQFKKPKRVQKIEDRGIEGVEVDEPWFSENLWAGTSLVVLAVAFILVPVIVYLCTFIPFFFIDRNPPYAFLDLFRMQARMWDGQQRVVTPHPYMSGWLGWPWLVRPIWYAFDHDKDLHGRDWVRGVLLLGNPFLMWGGMAAILYNFYQWLSTRSKSAFLIFTAWCALYFTWGIIPRKINFYYYYYPAGMILSLAWTQALKEFRKTQPWVLWTVVGASFVIFVYFYPILAAQRIAPDSFRKWMWFSSWI